MKTLTVAVLIATTLSNLAGEIAEYHAKHAKDKVGSHGKSRSGREITLADHGITEIGIEHTACLGDCPVFTFVIKSDGTFRYTGVAHVDHKGEFTGWLPEWRFHWLALFLKDSNYVEFEDTYTYKIYDATTTYTTIVMNDKRKTIKCIPGAAPIKLWAIERLIDDLAAQALRDGSPRKKQ